MIRIDTASTQYEVGRYPGYLVVEPDRVAFEPATIDETIIETVGDLSHTTIRPATMGDIPLSDPGHPTVNVLNGGPYRDEKSTEVFKRGYHAGRRDAELEQRADLTAKNFVHHDMINTYLKEGELSRNTGDMCPYKPGTPAHNLHSYGWLKEDLRQALMLTSPEYAASQGRTVDTGEDEAAHWKRCYEEQVKRCARLEDENAELTKKLATAEVEYNNMRGEREEWKAAWQGVTNHRTELLSQLNDKQEELAKASNGYRTYKSKYEELSKIHQRGVEDYTSDLAKKWEKEFHEADAHRVELENAARVMSKHLEYCNKTIGDLRRIFGQFSPAFETVNDNAKSAASKLETVPPFRIRPVPGAAPYSVMGDNDGPYRK